ncbi:c-type cytochrome [Massilia glaciei]|uniref:Cytochrome C n=1 Tax=Massilia glaciei TaxID=1524097 RepID=A0A2U2H8W2_9BURK|nr:c-type cytochrome [Massilia glaciei]PWF39049.1 cytochrome C [Massilia glaciei]
MNMKLRLITGALALGVACGAAAGGAPAPVSAPVSAPFAVPAESSIPPGPQGLAIREGKKLLTQTRLHLPRNVGNGLNCSSCHLAGGTTPKASPWVGIWGVFPEFRSRSGKVISLTQRVNDCFERSMNGKPLAYDSAEMNHILAYMQWLSTGVPTGTSVKGRGFGPLDQKLKPDLARGKVVYSAKCASCHGAAGAGIANPAGGYLFPPVAGNDSFNDGAGMARTYTAAAFVKHNMPLGQGGSLSDQEALDVAEYFTRLPRPVYKFKARDWPKGGKPKDARS